MYVLYTGSNLWDAVNSFKSDLVCLCSALPARLVNSRSVVLVAQHGHIRTVLSLVQREGTDKATYSVPCVAIERVRFMHAWKNMHCPVKSTFQVSSRLLRLEARGGNDHEE